MDNTGKHCAVCQENFGDKFSFCPVCGTPLQTAKTEEVQHFTDAPPTTRLENKVAPAKAYGENFANANYETVNNGQNRTSNFSKKEQTSTANITNGSNGDVIKQKAQPKTAPKIDNFVAAKDEFASSNSAYRNDGLFHITILEEPSRAQRNVFRAGALAGLFLLLTSVVGLYIYDLYRYPLDIDEVDVGEMISPVFTSEATPEEKQPVVPKNTDKGGGGGGGGRDDPKPVSFGKLAPQSRTEPEIAPSKDVVQRDSQLKQRATTVGDDKRVDPRDIPYGDPNSKSTEPSDGFGKLKSGQGFGDGTGQGNGRGRGSGNGIGTGRGNGRGDGNGNGDGNGDNGTPPPPIVRPTPKPTPEVAAVTEQFKILSQPKATYTEEARKNQVQGTVRLRVTFSASGQVTGITPISSLPNGLTEQAIAAARRIQFSPAKKNGVPVSTSKVLEYGFNIY